MRRSLHSLAGVVGVMSVWVLAPTNATAMGRSVPIPSLEWLVIDSDVVIRCEVTQIGPADANRWREVHIRVLESLKGNEHDELTVATSSYSTDLPHWVGKELLLFLVQSVRVHHPHDIPASCRLVIPGGYTYEPEWTAVRLDGDRNAIAINMAGDVVRGREALLDATREAANHPHRGRTRSARFSVMWLPRDAFGLVYSFHHPGMDVPVDDRLEALAKAWIASESPTIRARGVTAIRPFPSDENVKLLMSLLQDPCRQADGSYPVRRIARSVLEAWGVLKKEQSEKPHDVV